MPPSELTFSRRGQALVGQQMFAVLEKARELEDGGAKIFHLELGNPRLQAPSAMMARTIQSLVGNDVGYTQSAGHPALRQAIARHYSGQFQRAIAESNVVISPANLIINQFLDLVCNPGDRVVFFTPAFPTYWAAAAHIGLNVESVPLDPIGGYDLTDAAISQAMAARPKAIIVNSANNPTGAVYARDKLERLATECDRAGIWLLSDETYAEISFTRPFHSLGHLDLPHLVVMSSFSKLFSVPGFRIGFIVAQPEVARKFALSVSTLISCLPIFTQLGCVTALETLHEYAAEVRERCAQMTRLCSEALRKTNRITFSPPDAGFYFFLDVSSSGLDDLAFSQRLLVEGQTAVTPGSSFGSQYNGHIRIATCGSVTDVREGVDRIVSFIESF